MSLQIWGLSAQLKTNITLKLFQASGFVGKRHFSTASFEAIEEDWIGLAQLQLNWTRSRSCRLD